VIPNREAAFLLHEQRAHSLQEEARIERLLARQSHHSVRRVIGRSMVSLGARLAGDPIHQPARST
jgi:hypothetical protein